MLEQTPREQRQQLIDANYSQLSLRRQCALLQINRSTFYYEPEKVNAEDIDLINEIREIWERYPFYGYRRITKELKFKGHNINRKRVQRLMRLAGFTPYTQGLIPVNGTNYMLSTRIYCGILELFGQTKCGWLI